MLLVLKGRKVLLRGKISTVHLELNFRFFYNSRVFCMLLVGEG
jgi:hypothetical protein